MEAEKCASLGICLEICFLQQNTFHDHLVTASCRLRHSTLLEQMGKSILRQRRDSQHHTNENCALLRNNKNQQHAYGSDSPGT